jgi:putative nucleotidyltransferase with HDIG domain
MKTAAATAKELIDVDALRVGMFVHLDVGWMSHPFPLSSFRISSADQVATIRSLGLQRVRWSPQLSDAPPVPVPPGVRDFAASAAAPLLDLLPGRTLAPTAAAAAGAADAEVAERTERRRLLSEQRAALALCERQFAEAAHECREIADMVVLKPQQARAQAEKLSGALVSKMLETRELCIRLLSEGAGDKASTHALNVALVALMMARSLGLGEPEMVDLGVGSMLHDVGKLDVPERLRHREDDFTGAELRAYEEHVAYGVAIARRMGLSPGASLVIAQHHENADGSGFPLRLTAERMTPLARIVAIVNRYDNLCNPNIAARALTPHEALSLLFAQGKSKFDTAILGAFIKMMGVYPPGSAVQLTDDRYALVVGVNSMRPLKPRVLVHEPGVPRDEALILDLESVPGLGIRRSLKPQQLPPESLDYLDPRPRVAYFFEPVRDPAGDRHGEGG